jgi:hypothetical protein
MIRARNNMESSLRSPRLSPRGFSPVSLRGKPPTAASGTARASATRRGRVFGLRGCEPGGGRRAMQGELGVGHGPDEHTRTRTRTHTHTPHRAHGRDSLQAFATTRRTGRCAPLSPCLFTPWVLLSAGSGCSASADKEYPGVNVAAFPRPSSPSPSQWLWHVLSSLPAPATASGARCAARRVGASWVACRVCLLPAVALPTGTFFFHIGALPAGRSSVAGHAASFATAACLPAACLPLLMDR